VYEADPAEGEGELQVGGNARQQQGGDNGRDNAAEHRHWIGEGTQIARMECADQVIEVRWASLRNASKPKTFTASAPGRPDQP
jgi:hypothetical protein